MIPGTVGGFLTLQRRLCSLYAFMLAAWPRSRSSRGPLASFTRERADNVGLRVEGRQVDCLGVGSAIALDAELTEGHLLCPSHSSSDIGVKLVKVGRPHVEHLVSRWAFQVVHVLHNCTDQTGYGLFDQEELLALAVPLWDVPRSAGEGWTRLVSPGLNGQAGPSLGPTSWTL